MFVCPLCGLELLPHEKALRCGKGHSFDISRSGYVNLLLSQSSSAKRHGDDRLMVRARRDFLDRGYYRPLCEAVLGELRAYFPETGTLLDAGCGEGYYTEAAALAFPKAEILGIDISKDALSLAARRCAGARFAVAGVTAVPAAPSSCDAVMNLFAPLSEREFLRILRPGGILLRVIVLEKHLYELKQAVYEHPYENTVPDPELPGFELLSQKDVLSVIRVQGQEDIGNLFRMTPYYYKTGAEDQRKLLALDSLETQTAFRIILYRKPQE